MPIRIYALAKELQIDNKKLVDICTRAGITGKGSALASLTDEEVVRLKAFMAGGRQRGGRRTAPRAARTADAARRTGRSIRREDYIAPAGTAAGTKVPVLPAKQDKPPRAPEGLRKKPEETAPPVRPAVDVPPAAPAAPVVRQYRPRRRLRAVVPCGNAAGRPSHAAGCGCGIGCAGKSEVHRSLRRTRARP